MALIFALRGTTTTAYYSTENGAAGKFNNDTNGNPAVVADAAAFGGSAIDLSLANSTGSNINRYLSYVGRNNWSNTTTIAVLMRFAPGWSGLPSSRARALWSANTGNVSRGFGQTHLLVNTNGTFNVWLSRSDTGTADAFFASGVVAWSATSGTYTDVMLSWDGTNNANSIKISINGVEHETLTPATSMGTRDNKSIGNINIGMVSGNSGLNGKVSELLIWNSAENHVYATRTDFFSTTAFDGSSYSDPGSANVLSGTAYTFAGVSLTGSLSQGTYTDPGTANVKLATSYIFNSVTQTGSYVLGTYSDPGTTNVRLNTSYIFNSVTQTGSLTVPTPASGTAGTIDISNIKENLRYILDTANTTTASPIDLSNNLTTRVKQVMKVNPEKIKVDVQSYPCVTIFTNKKTIELKTIAKDQVTGKRKCQLLFTIVGIIWNDLNVDYRKDQADEDVEILMENIEGILRSYANISSTVTWQFPTDITYHSVPYAEDVNMRVGVMDLQATIFY